MATIRPFRAVRPAGYAAKDVAALPYDVYSREEAAEAVAGKPLSFLNIDRPETMFDPSHDMYAQEVYEAAKNRYEEQKKEGVYIQDSGRCFYIYEETMNGRTQTGIAALSSVDDYLNQVCKKHENTVEKKELDRINHVDTMSAQTGPIFLSYHADGDIDDIIWYWKVQHTAVYDFTSEDEIRHRVWVIDERTIVNALEELFHKLDCTYIADGHHRAASAVKVALRRRAEAGDSYDPNAEYNFFLSVLFPDNQLEIFDYNRVVKDLNGYCVSDFIGELEKDFDVDFSDRLKPEKKYEIGMYLDGRNYMLHLKEEYIDMIKNDPVKSLDVAVLQDHVLSKILGIEDPRTDSRIRFVGGIRGVEELVKDADVYTKAGEESGKGPAVAFAMYPTSIQELFKVADAGLLMPPKSTWFEPKLRSGLFIHEF